MTEEGLRTLLITGNIHSMDNVVVTGDRIVRFDSDGKILEVRRTTSYEAGVGLVLDRLKGAATSDCGSYSARIETSYVEPSD